VFRYLALAGAATFARAFFMATTAEIIAALQTALAKGVLEVRSADGETVRFASPKDLADAIAKLQGETDLGGSSGRRIHLTPIKAGGPT